MSLPIIPTIKSVTDLRYQTAEIIKLLDKDQPVVITRENDTVAVMFSPVYYQRLVDLFEQFEEKMEAKRLEKAIEEGDKFEKFSDFDKKQRRKLKID